MLNVLCCPGYRHEPFQHCPQGDSHARGKCWCDASQNFGTCHSLSLHGRCLILFYRLWVVFLLKEIWRPVPIEGWLLMLPIYYAHRKSVSKRWSTYLNNWPLLRAECCKSIVVIILLKHRIPTEQYIGLIGWIASSTGTKFVFSIDLKAITR